MNLSILQRNMLGTMSEDAQLLYLRGCERDEWAACQMAWEWDVLLDSKLAEMIQAAASICANNGIGDGSDPGVLVFIKERHFRRYFPNGRAA